MNTSKSSGTKRRSRARGPNAAGDAEPEPAQAPAPFTLDDLYAEIDADPDAAMRAPGEVDLKQLAAKFGGSISKATRYAALKVEKRQWTTRKVYDPIMRRTLCVWRRRAA